MIEPRPDEPGTLAPPDATAGIPIEDAIREVPPPPPPAGRPPLAWKHYLWIIGAALVVVAALHWLGPVLTPFLVGAILAYLGTPVVDKLQRRRVPRTIGTLVVVLAFGILIIGLMFVLIPLIRAEFAQATKRLPALMALFTEHVSPWLEEHLGLHVALDLESIKAFIAENSEGASEISMRVLASMRTGGLFVLSLIVNLALVPVVMFYLLRDWNMILARVGELIPLRWRAKTRSIVFAIDRVLAEFLRGQLMVMGALAVYYAIALSLAGLQFALPIGILTGVLVFIPYVGFGLGLVLGIVAALLQWNGLPGFLAVLAVYGLGQLLENYVLIPWLVGDRIGLHPIAVIFSLLAFGHLFGFAGVLLALPLSAALLVGLRHVRAEYVDSPLYQAEP